MEKTFYVTTPIYYVNAEPHIGHAYTNIAADCISRYERLRGREVFFLTGTDEHGQKIAQAAGEKGIDEQSFVDAVVPRFNALWEKLSIAYSDFIRTTQDRHIRVVQHILRRLYDKGDLYLENYEGWYCVPCETFWPETQLTEMICPDCQRPLEKIVEENFFFRLSRYQQWLRSYIEEHEEFVLPSSRRNEIMKFLENPLSDLCITRPKTRISWGIDVPFSKGHVVYVWFDALINYISAAGFAADEDRFNRLWPCEYHLIGKDILRPHTVYWPIMLRALDLPLPRTVFAHGWWQLAGGKISKSKGNVVDPIALVERYGQDAFRYFLLRDVRFGLDGVYSEEALARRYNNDLGNDLGNLLQRTLTMTEKYFEGRVPASAPKNDDDLCRSVRTAQGVLWGAMEAPMNQLNFSEALTAIWSFISLLNRFVEETAPWSLAKEGKKEYLAGVVFHLLEGLRVAALALFPFMPNAAARMWGQLGMTTSLEKASYNDIRSWGLIQPGQRIGEKEPLFPRITVPEC
ncbi:MAG: methionine--tRNA ligase [Candidatus Omnitrophica bacterium]|nr:methionine--tRNA ligase [Candidatus Omnitrophota bacterium]